MKDIMTYDEAHYFGAVDAESYDLGGVITELSESSNPKEETKHYIHQKSGNTKVTGYENEFPITMDMVKGDAVYDDFYQLFYERKTGNDLLRDHVIVNLWELNSPETPNVYKARKITQTVEINDCNGEAGGQKQISGSLKGGDFVYGTFDTSTKKFTANV